MRGDKAGKNKIDKRRSEEYKIRSLIGSLANSHSPSIPTCQFNNNHPDCLHQASCSSAVPGFIAQGSNQAQRSFLTPGTKVTWTGLIQGGGKGLWGGAEDRGVLRMGGSVEGRWSAYLSDLVQLFTFHVQQRRERREGKEEGGGEKERRRVEGRRKGEKERVERRDGWKEGKGGGKTSRRKCKKAKQKGRKEKGYWSIRRKWERDESRKKEA
ncbi:hypothetical protein Pmani_020308 [Petrolisthes manimaculis]|uniref:Uncharacterized protein n=1 Tax=Petrolisthes manimaculis TaxID=1843537 RepID=A0AAE1PHY8_9EUCA|nr:hypothetical protein Pmani_020308 [Petrolisthes manimaculis]